MPTLAVVIPVFNEEKTLRNILARVGPKADYLICVDDGSRDRSLSILKEFARTRKNTFFIHLEQNTGMAGALKHGFLFSLYLRGKNLLRDDDVVVTIDADGQHKPEYIPEIASYMGRKGMDIVLTRRDFSLYPLYKVWGNRLLTWTNSLLSGKRYYDVESGLRFLKVKTLPAILRYYTGVKYSCAQEIALLSARAGFKIDNEFLVNIAYYRAGTTVFDGVIVLALSGFSFLRWLFGIGSEIQDDAPWMRAAFEESARLWPRRGSPKRRRK